MKNRTYLGKAKDCSLIRKAVKGLSDEQITRLKQQIRDNPTLYPCPQERLWWIYKSECDFCPQAVREK